MLLLLLRLRLLLLLLLLNQVNNAWSASRSAALPAGLDLPGPRQLYVGGRRAARAQTVVNTSLTHKHGMDGQWIPGWCGPPQLGEIGFSRLLQSPLSAVFLHLIAHWPFPHFLSTADTPSPSTIHPRICSQSHATVPAA